MTAVRLESIGRGEHHVYVLHGILGSGRNWRSFARKLVRQRPDLTVHLLDQRNHGAAPPSEPPHTLAACAADVQAVIEATAPPAALVGHSFGGKVVLTWADAFGGAPVFSPDCNGCCQVNYRGEDLGEVCPDFSGLTYWEGRPWN